MRTSAAVILGLLFPAVVGAAQAESRWAVQGVADLTKDQAIARFGNPHYEHQCADGTITMAWKRSQPAAAQAAGPAQKKNLVIKFRPTGSQVWARELR